MRAMSVVLGNASTMNCRVQTAVNVRRSRRANVGVKVAAS